jgi:hypothetical protein
VLKRLELYFNFQVNAETPGWALSRIGYPRPDDGKPHRLFRDSDATERYAELPCIRSSTMIRLVMCLFRFCSGSNHFDGWLTGEASG